MKKALKCPESIEALEELEQLLPLCKEELYKQAQARIETGAAKSKREAARQIGEELDRSPDTIRTALDREEAKMASVTPKSQFRTSFTGENEWYTPAIYIEAARAVLGTIDLDPATSDFAQQRIKAIIYYTKDMDGLKQVWHGKTWLNPPFSQPLINQFITKTITEFTENRISEAIVLTNNYTDTAWFHQLEAIAGLLCFTKGRIKFDNKDGIIAQPTQGACFFYLGNNEVKFKEVFQQFGFIR